MILLAACCLVAAAASAADLPELRVAPAHWLTGEPPMNARPCALAEGGALQFLFPEHLAVVDFEGTLRRIALPEVAPPVWFEAMPVVHPALAALQLSGASGVLAAKHRGGLTLYRLGEGDTWTEAWSGAWEWPGAGEWQSERPELGTGLCAVHVASTGAWSVSPGGSPALVSLYTVEPLLRLASASDLFTTESRNERRAESRRNFEHFHFPGGRWASVRQSPDVDGHHAVWVVTSEAPEGGVRLPVEADAYPVFLDPAQREPVFVQVSAPESAEGLITESVRELRIVSGGETGRWKFADPLAHQRAVSFALVNGDDKLDLVLQEFRIVGPDPKESLARLLTSERVRLRISVYLHGDAGIAPRATFAHEVEIRLDRPPANRGPRLDALLRGDLIALAPLLGPPGSPADLFVHESPGVIVLYAGNGSGFADSPAQTFRATDAARVRVVPRDDAPSLPVLEEVDAAGIVTRVLDLPGTAP
jgi:hypothetical protein